MLGLQNNRFYKQTFLEKIDFVSERYWHIILGLHSISLLCINGDYDAVCGLNNIFNLHWIMKRRFFLFICVNAVIIVVKFTKNAVTRQENFPIIG